MNKLIATMILLFSPGLSGAYDFKGIEIGEPADMSIINEILSTSCPLVSVCYGSPTVAGVSAQAIIKTVPDGIVNVISLSFASDDFDSVERAVLEKFGKPTETEHTQVSNRMGASFPQVQHTWRDEDGNVVTLMRYSGNLDDSLLGFFSAAHVRTFEEQAKEDAQDL